jgi:hypothetical protein
LLERRFCREGAADGLLVGCGVHLRRRDYQRFADAVEGVIPVVKGRIRMKDITTRCRVQIAGG